MENKKLPGPGFEPGLLRPQRRVLTTRRSRHTIYTAEKLLFELNIFYVISAHCLLLSLARSTSGQYKICALGLIYVIFK